MKLPRKHTPARLSLRSVPACLLGWALLLAACAPVDSPPAPPEDDTKERRTQPPELLRRPFQCQVPEDLHSVGDLESLHLSRTRDLARYQRVLLEPAEVRHAEPREPDNRRVELDDRLDNILEEALRSDWRYRFGWTEAHSAEQDVLRVKAWMTDVRIESGEDWEITLELTLQLEDSLDGTPLLYSCKQPIYGDATSEQAGWRDLQQSLQRWAARIGSHLMVSF